MIQTNHGLPSLLRVIIRSGLFLMPQPPLRSATGEPLSFGLMLGLMEDPSGLLLHSSLLVLPVQPLYGEQSAMLCAIMLGSETLLGNYL